MPPKPDVSSTSPSSCPSPSWWIGLSRSEFTKRQAEEQIRMNRELPCPGVQSVLNAVLELEARELLGLETKRTRDLRKIARVG